jgi:DNA primase
VAKYINSPETPIYSKSRMLYGLNLVRSEIKKKEEAVVVEGELDMISSWQAGIKNTVAIKGTALTEDQLRLLARFARKLILALDADIAGNEAARRGINLAQDAGLEVRVAVLKDFKDPDEMARRAPGEYKKLLSSAVGVWDFVVAQIFSKYNQSTAEGKARIGRELVPILASIENKIIQAHYVQLVARKLAIPTEAIIEQIAKTKIQTKTRESRVAVLPKPKSKPRRQLLEERLLTLAFQSKPKILAKKEIASLIKIPLTSRILEEYKTFTQKNSSFDPSEFASNLPKELVKGFADMILKDVGDLINEPGVLNKELNLVIKELKTLSIKENLSLLGKKIKECEEKDKKDKLKKAEEKFRKLSLKLSELKKDETSSIIL